MTSPYRTPEEAKTIRALVATRLRDLRLRKNLTQREIAERMQMQRPLVSRMERATHAPSLALIIRVCVALRVRPSEALAVLDAYVASLIREDVGPPDEQLALDFTPKEERWWDDEWYD